MLWHNFTVRVDFLFTYRTQSDDSDDVNASYGLFETHSIMHWIIYPNGYIYKLILLNLIRFKISVFILDFGSHMFIRII